MKKYTQLLLPLLLVSLTAMAAGQGYKINFTIKGLKDTTCLIGNYYGNGTYIKDTLQVDRQGRCQYKAGPDFPKGIYIFIITEKVYFDFIVNNDHDFSIEVEKNNPLGTIKISGSPENTLFYSYLDYNRQKYGIISNFQGKIKEWSDNADSVKLFTRRVEELNKELIDYKMGLIREYPGSFLAFMINVMKEPEIPEAPTLPNGRKDSLFPYRYYKNHFWDGTDLADDRALRTPVFHNKLKKYFTQVVVQNPDTLIVEVDRMVEKTRSNPEMFKYLVWFCTYTFENSEIMGLDKVFVHIIDNYYITGQAVWVTPQTKENLIKKAGKLKPLLIGQVAPNMIMQDTSLQLVSMYNIKANFLILLFWDPDCGHCEQEIPKLHEFYLRAREEYGIEVMAVCSDTSLVKWKSAIKKKKTTWINVDGPRTLTGNYHQQYDITTTPEIYILNERKEIIAKHLRHDQVESFIKNYRLRGTATKEKPR